MKNDEMALEKGRFHQFVKEVLACWLFLCVLGERVDFHGRNRAQHRKKGETFEMIPILIKFIRGILVYVVEKMPEKW